MINLSLSEEKSILMLNDNVVSRSYEADEWIIQFGECNFLRAFVDWIIDMLKRETDFKGKVVIVKPILLGNVDTINCRNGLYNTFLKGYVNRFRCKQVVE